MDRRKSLLNVRELQTFDALLESIAEHEGQVFTKIRIADALDIQDSDIPSELYGYAMKAHFDFVVGRGPLAETLFAVEFDGPTHNIDPKTRANDEKKEVLCRMLGLPLLRIDGAMLKKIGKTTLVGWLAHMWFMNEAWDQSPHDPFAEFDTTIWFKINPMLEKVVTELLEQGQSVVNGVTITGETALDHPEWKKLSKVEVDVGMDPFFPSRSFLAAQREVLGYTYQVGRCEGDNGYWRATTTVKFRSGQTIVGRGGCKPNAWPAIWDLPENLSMHDAACQVKLYEQRLVR